MTQRSFLLTSTALSRVLIDAHFVREWLELLRKKTRGSGR